MGYFADVGAPLSEMLEMVQWTEQHCWAWEGEEGARGLGGGSHQSEVAVIKPSSRNVGDKNDSSTMAVAKPLLWSVWGTFVRCSPIYNCNERGDGRAGKVEIDYFPRSPVTM